MASAAEIVHQFLNDAGIIDLSGDWPGYISFMPANPDQAVCIYDMTGSTDGRLMDGTQIHHPGVQIQIRSTTYAIGWAKAAEITNALDGQIKTLVPVESDAVYILHNASRRGAIHAIGIDKEDRNRRHNFSVHVMLTFSAT